MATEYIESEMGMKVSETTRAEAISVELSQSERDMYTKRFQSIDQEKKGYITITDIRRYLLKTKVGSITIGKFLPE